MNKIGQKLKGNWQSLMMLLAALLAISFLYLIKIDSLTHRLLSSREADIHYSYQSLHIILNNPVNLPYRLIDYSFLHIVAHNTAYTRFTSVLFGLVACALFFIIIRRWHGQRAAVLATTLFSTSSWMLHVARLGTYDVVLILIPLVLMLLASWIISAKRHGLVLICMTIISALVLYTPGATWLLIGGFILIRKSIINHIRHAKLWHNLLSILILLLAISVLVYSIYHSPHYLRTWLFLPSTFPGPMTLLHNWINSVTFLFIRGPYMPDIWLAHIPIFDVFTSVMCLLGISFYVRNYKNLRVYALVCFLGLGSILVALNGVNSIGYIVPIGYLLVGTGLAYLMHEWLTVFPRNPVARSVGVLLVTSVVLITVGYNLTSYFVAWRHSPDTAQAFQQKP